MSRKINVNPDHYKLAGRERQGEQIVHEAERRSLTALRSASRGRTAPTASAPPQRGAAGAKRR